MLGALVQQRTNGRWILSACRGTQLIAQDRLERLQVLNASVQLSLSIRAQDSHSENVDFPDMPSGGLGSVVRCAGQPATSHGFGLIFDTVADR
jgi:hypothetical protein